MNPRKLYFLVDKALQSELPTVAIDLAVPSRELEKALLLLQASFQYRDHPWHASDEQDWLHLFIQLARRLNQKVLHTEYAFGCLPVAIVYPHYYNQVKDDVVVLEEMLSHVIAENAVGLYPSVEQIVILLERAKIMLHRLEEIRKMVPKFLAEAIDNNNDNS